MPNEKDSRINTLLTKSSYIDVLYKVSDWLESQGSTPEEVEFFERMATDIFNIAERGVVGPE